MTYQLIPADKRSSPPIPVHRPVLLIGRHPECDFRIDLPKISRRHCCVALAYDKIFVRDLGSHNGVRVNGRVVEEATLQAGDEVAIGPLIYRLVAESAIASQAGARGTSGGNAETCRTCTGRNATPTSRASQAIGRHRLGSPR